MIFIQVPSWCKNFTLYSASSQVQDIISAVLCRVIIFSELGIGNSFEETVHSRKWFTRVLSLNYNYQQQDKLKQFALTNGAIQASCSHTSLIAALRDEGEANERSFLERRQWLTRKEFIVGVYSFIWHSPERCPKFTGYGIMASSVLIIGVHYSNYVDTFLISIQVFM